MPNFESLARRYRFQALGKACRDHGIKSLLVAHHGDDQAETVLMRLVHGHRSLGLAGIKRDSAIPECQGLHGIHESGGIDYPGKARRQAMHSSPGNSGKKVALLSRAVALGENSSRPKRPFSLVSEAGGVRVYRPLLEFNKARLIATCQAEKMEWFEDHTNNDPTLTMRNAVRYMLGSHKMPAALTTASLLEVARKFRSKTDLLGQTTRILFKKCIIADLNTRIGTISISFPSLDQAAFPLELLPWENRGQLAASLLRKVIMIATPQKEVHLSSLHGAVERVFPELTPINDPPAVAIPFTTSGVFFQPVVPKEGPGVNILSSKKCYWIVSRQPHRSGEQPTICFPASKEPSAWAEWTSWELYDGRFWFRVKNPTADSLLIRPLKQDDLVAFETSLRKRLKILAPAEVRWTLPAIAILREDGSERILALPTINIRDLEFGRKLRWEVRYKKVDLDATSE